MRPDVHLWSREAIDLLAKAGLAVKIAACTCGAKPRVELCEPSRTADGDCHLFVSHTICEDCAATLEAADAARQKYDAATWERPE